MIFNLTGAIVYEEFPYKDIQDSENFIQSRQDHSATLAGIIVNKFCLFGLFCIKNFFI